MGASHRVFDGENSVLQSPNSLLEEIRIKPGSWNDFEEYPVISPVRVANAGANGGAGGLGISFSRLALV